MHSWVHVMNWRANLMPDDIALQSDAEKLTYGQLHHLVNRRAGGWVAAGLGSGDVVMILARNSVEFLVQSLALQRLGAIPFLVNWRLTPTEINQLTELTSPRGIFADSHGVGLVAAADFELAITTAPTAPAPWQPVSTLDAAASPWPTQRLQEHEPAFLMHTSGTTGRPKVIALDHGSLVKSLAGFALDIGEQKRGSRHLLFLPLFHLAGYAQAMQSLLTAGTLIIHDGFDAEAVLATIEKEQVEFFTAVPTIIGALTDALEQTTNPPDVTSLIEVQYGASPIEPELLLRATKVLCNRFRQIYGSTELQGFFTNLPPEEHHLDSPGLATAGRVVQGWRYRIVDTADTPVTTGAAGELQLQGASLIREYWNDPAATAAAFTSDGWYRTGDLARETSSGFIQLVGRSTEMIVSGGENIYPAEIERVLVALPSIHEAAVVGVPHPTWGEVPVAFVVADADAPFEEATILEQCRANLAGFKCPHRIITVPHLPRNALGKVTKFELTAQLPLAE